MTPEPVRGVTLITDKKEITLKLMTLLYSSAEENYLPEVEKLQALEKAIATATASQVKLAVSDSQSLPLPKSVYELLKVALPLMVQGKAITLVPVSPEITTTQAAEILNVSRPYLAKLLDEGAIPSHRVGTHRRLHLEDLLSYKNHRDAQRKEGLEKLAQLSQEYGLYTLDYEELDISEN